MVLLLPRTQNKLWAMLRCCCYCTTINSTDKPRIALESHKSGLFWLFFFSFLWQSAHWVLTFVSMFRRSELAMNRKVGVDIHVACSMRQQLFSFCRTKRENWKPDPNQLDEHFNFKMFELFQFLFVSFVYSCHGTICHENVVTQMRKNYFIHVMFLSQNTTAMQYAGCWCDNFITSPVCLVCFSVTLSLFFLILWWLIQRLSILTISLTHYCVRSRSRITCIFLRFLRSRNWMKCLLYALFFAECKDVTFITPWLLLPHQHRCVCSQRISILLI